MRRKFFYEAGMSSEQLKAQVQHTLIFLEVQNVKENGSLLNIKDHIAKSIQFQQYQNGQFEI